MSPAEDSRGGEHAVALLSLFAGILGVALALRQLGASMPVLWVVVGLAFVIPAAMGNFSIPRFMRRGPDPVLVASACRRVASAIDGLWMERRDWTPQPGAPASTAKHQWRLETERLYDEGLRPWAIEVFEEAVACGALTASSRSLVQNPPPTQLHKLGDLFREAADILEGERVI